MLDNIRKKVFENYEKTENKGFFISGFDVSGNLLFSQGLLEADKDLGTILESLYYNTVEKHKKTVKILVCDVVSNIIGLSDINDVMTKSPKEYGFYMASVDGEKTGLILPDMQGVQDAKTALYQIKQKYNLSGNVMIKLFTTTRLQIDL